MSTLFVRIWRRKLFLVIVLGALTASSAPARAQFPGFAGMYGYGMPGGYGYGYGFGMPGFGGGFYGAPVFGIGYPAMIGGFGYGFGGPIWGGYGGYGFGYAPVGFFGGYPGLGYGMPGLWNPLFGAGLTPLGVASFQYETQVFGRVPRRTVKYFGFAN